MTGSNSIGGHFTGHPKNYVIIVLCVTERKSKILYGIIF